MAKIWTRTDPWLAARIARMADVRRADLAITNSLVRAMTEWLAAAEKAIYRRGTADILIADAGDHTASTGDPGDVLPDFSLWPGPSSWQAIVERVVAPDVGKLFGQAFAKSIRDADISSEHYVQAHTALVRDRLSKNLWPDVVFDDARKIVADGIAQGLSITDITANLSGVLSPDAQAWQARRIARTEVMGAVNSGTWNGASAYAEHTGQEMFKQWYATLDSRVRPDHREAHRQVVAIAADFDVGGFAMSYPGDPDGPASEVCNCRCTLLMLTGDEADEFLRDDAWDDDEPSTDPAGQEAAMTASILAAAAAPAPADPDDPQDPADDGAWYGVLAPLGEPSGDGRMIASPDGGTPRTRPMPVPLLYQDALAPIHGGAVAVGLIRQAWVDPDTGDLMGAGTFDLTDPRAAAVAAKVASGNLGWVSVDLDDTTMEYVEADGAPEGSGLDVAMDWRLMGATLVSQPAFPTAKIRMGIAPDQPQADAPAAAVAADTALAASTTLGAPLPPAAGVLRTGAPPPPGGTVQFGTATAVGFAPSAAWFDDPRLDGPTPLTVTDDGRVFGHLAAWDVCHTGFPGQCVVAPKSASAYAYFHLGTVRTAEGTDVAVGSLTLDTDHAAEPWSTRERMAWSLRDAQRHYADTGMAAAVVRAGEDEYGIWVAGAVLPGADVVTLRRAPLSGDWRKVGGSLELVGALAVNQPGFPVPRWRTGQDAELYALCAAGAIRRPQVSIGAPPPGGPLVEELAVKIATSLVRLQAEQAARGRRIADAQRRIRGLRFSRSLDALKASGNDERK